MKFVLRGVGAFVLLLVVLYGVQMIAAESGEVVVLTTQDDNGEPQETRLWVVDREGRAWLRSGSEIQSWYGNLKVEPEIAVLRGEESKRYTAVPVLEARDEINRLMAEKYGWADAYIGFLFTRDNAIPIRLDPLLFGLLR